MGVHDAVVDAVLQRLDTGFDVLLDGDAGSGRSRVLAELAQRLHDAGRPALLVRPRRVTRELPFSALHAHPGFLAAVEGRPTAADVFAWLGARFDGPRPVLLLDDVQDTDRASLGLLLASAQAAGARCVLVVSDGDGPAFASRELGLCCSRVEVPPLGIRGMTELLAEHTAGTAEASVIAEATTATGGNPRAALLLFEAAVRAGRVERRDGVWTGTTAPGEVDLADLPPALLSHLPPSSARALRLLAWCGAVPLHAARELVGADALDALVAAGRVVTAALDDDRTVVVSPPVLSRALLAGLSPFDRAELADAARGRLGDEGGGAGWALDADPAWWQRSTRELDPPDPQLPASITLLTERLQSRLAALRRDWREARDVASALPVLRILMVSLGDPARLEEVFAATRPAPDDSAEDVAAYLVLRHQWRLAQGGGDEPLVPDDWDPGAWAPAIRQAVDGLLRPLREGRPVAAVLAEQPEEVPPVLRNTLQLLRAEAALEEGLAGEAEALAHAVATAHAPTDLIDRLAATRGDAILLGGRLAAATGWSRRHLAEGYDRGDPFTVKLHARGLASALLISGDEAGAWRAISAALRIGRPGPLSAALDERVLALAAVLCARRGDRRGAESFIAELRRLDPLVRPRIDIMLDWSSAELRYAADPADAEAGDLLAAAADREFARGARLPAVLCLLLTATPLPQDRLALLERAWPGMDAPLLRPAVALHRLLPASGPRPLLRALGHYHGGGPLERTVFRLAAERYLDETGSALTAAAVEHAAGPSVAARWRAFAAETPDRPSPLTDREREVLELAKAGLSNREIAESLYLSLRTVENHLYRVRVKTGISRAELAPATAIHG